MADPEQPLMRVMTSLPRSGTHWCKRMISFVLGETALEERLLVPDDLRRALATEAHRRLIYDHFDFDTHATLLNPQAEPGLRMMLLYRNPVDALISGFHLLEAQGPLPAEGVGALENFRLYLHGHWLGRKLPERYRDNPLLTVSFREWIRRRVLGWFQCGYCLPVRYEDLVAQVRPVLRGIVEHLGIPYTEESLDGAIQANTFEKLSGGRPRGAEDRTSHYRRGIPGEWQSVLDDRDLAAVRHQIGDYLQQLGYDMGEPVEVVAACHADRGNCS